MFIVFLIDFTFAFNVRGRLISLVWRIRLLEVLHNKISLCKLVYFMVRCKERFFFCVIKKMIFLKVFRVAAIEGLIYVSNVSNPSLVGTHQTRLVLEPYKQDQKKKKKTLVSFTDKSIILVYFLLIWNFYDLKVSRSLRLRPQFLPLKSGKTCRRQLKEVSGPFSLPSFAVFILPLVVIFWTPSKEKIVQSTTLYTYNFIQGYLVVDYNL